MCRSCTDRAHPHHRGLQHVEHELRGQNQVTIWVWGGPKLATEVQVKPLSTEGSTSLNGRVSWMGWLRV